MVRFRDVLFRKNFFCLWSGQIISEFGDRLFQMALIALVYSKHPGSVMALANLLFFIIVPVFVIGPLAGVYVDRWDRKRVMIISDIVRGILVFLVPFLVRLDVMAPVYIVVFLIFSATRFFLPSKLAFIPDIVSREKLMVANSLSNTTRMIATVLGFAAAGFIVKWIGHVWGFYLDSISYFVSAALIALITPKEKLANVKEELDMTRKIIEKSIRTNVWSEIVEGFGHMFRKDKMKMVTSTFFLLMAGAGSIFCIIIVFIQNSFGSVTEDLGIFGVFLGLGLFLGTMLYAKYGQQISKTRAMSAGFIFCGIGICLFAVYANQDPLLVVGGVLIMLVGAAAAPILTCANTLIHVLVPAEVRGRIFSSMEAVVHLAFLVFMFLTAALSKVVSNFIILMTCGLVFTFVGVIGVVFARKKEENTKA
ncbi:MAG: MFS transporter [Candidatus Omnitrophica bacterium]|nr:MFS transporter [Candidatus Omnitrophota bacterium]